MDFRLLGPVEVRRDDQRVDLAGTKMHTLLAALLLARGKVVPDTRLSTLLWGMSPPTTMRAQIYTHVSRLRKLLEPEIAIHRRSPGYVLETGGSRVDVVEYDRLDRLGRQALRAGRYEEAGTLLRSALELWCGPVLSNATEFLVAEEGPQWDEGYAATLENRVEADLALGRHQQVIAELTRLVADFPLRERLRAQLMTALYRCGRQADALHVFRLGRSVLAEELGVDPGSELTTTHEAVLRGTLDYRGAVAGRAAQSSGAAPTTAVGSPATGPTTAGTGTAALPVAPRQVPAMLPPDTAAFVGRKRELDAVTALLAPADEPGGDPAGARRLLITGMAGVGKTSLAVRAAHAVRERFPDGQLYADLVASDGTPEDPRGVLIRLLRSLGHEPEQDVRHDLDELVRLYRTHTAGRRLFVLLDNGVSGAQLAPLLPASPHAGVLVTGHAHLAAVVGPDILALEPMPDRESLAVLRTIVGAGRVAAEPQAAAQIVAHCAGLPLALRIAGARLASRPHWPLARLAQRLAEPTERLRELRFGDLDLDRSLRSWLVRTGGQVRDLLARLSVLGEQPFTASEAATALGLSTARAEDVVEQLADGAALETVGPVEYRFHRLVLLYAQYLTAHCPQPVMPALVAA
ncbi:BTAD domain-containing putative transcriptional regulator [Streptomyces goshikiensis]|uniref:AfsR/SARP family transcriptional regulator n=1 Tax=Streptomyces goshikiensis TaxID=1942 RepID=UPI0036C692AA